MVLETVGSLIMIVSFLDIPFSLRGIEKVANDWKHTYVVMLSTFFFFFFFPVFPADTGSGWLNDIPEPKEKA